MAEMDDWITDQDDDPPDYDHEAADRAEDHAAAQAEEARGGA